MNTEKLLKYLSIIIDLEKNKYTQEETLKQLDNNIASYQNEYNYNQRSNENASASPAINYANVPVSQSGKGLMYFMIYYLGCIGAGLGAIAYHVLQSMGAALFFGAIGAIIGGTIPIIVWKNILAKRRTQAIVQLQRGNRADVELMQRRSERNNALATLLPKLQEEKRVLKETHQLTLQTLSKCYAVNIIPEKYRNIVPICMFYDYLVNGRTYSLVRNPNAFDEGAINMYEDECYRKLILSKLDVIINNLEDLKRGQKVLYDAIQEGNRQTHKLLNDINDNVSKVNSNLQTIQYQNEQRNRCLEYMSYVAYQWHMS